MRRRLPPAALALALVAATGGTVLVAAARAADAPAATPPAMAPQKKIEHPFAKAVLGDWDVEMKGPMSDGKATASFRLALGGTALIHDFEGTSAGGPFAGHGVYKLAPDGATIVSWWFDSHGAEPLKMMGPITDTTAELNGSSAMGPLTIRWKVVDGGLEFVMTSGGTAVMTHTYRRATR
jgi:hypothetical protein